MQAGWILPLEARGHRGGSVGTQVLAAVVGMAEVAWGGGAGIEEKGDKELPYLGPGSRETPER